MKHGAKQPETLPTTARNFAYIQARNFAYIQATSNHAKTRAKRLKTLDITGFSIMARQTERLKKSGNGKKAVCFMYVFVPALPAPL